jgi:hypothetical protein
METVLDFYYFSQFKSHAQDERSAGGASWSPQTIPNQMSSGLDTKVFYAYH